MSKTIFFVHSAGPQSGKEGSGEFISILKKSLGDAYDIKHPSMPEPEDPDYEPWRNQVRKEIIGLEEGSILIGHSLGGSVLLKYFSEEKSDKKYRALFIVASPFWGLKGWTYDAFCLKKGFAKNLTRFGKIFLYHTSDDDVVSHDHLIRYAKEIPNASVREVDGLGHLFNARECTELIRDIKSS